MIGAGAPALFKGTLGSVIAIAPPDRLGETLAAFFLCGYLGTALPAIVIGIALQHVPAPVALLAFAIIASAAILVCSRVLLADVNDPAQRVPADR